MKIAIYVMHVPGDPLREEALGTLTARIDGDCTFEVMRDPERRGVWWNAQRCWKAGIDTNADWIVVLNDDAYPCDAFVDHVRNALSSRDPRDPVCFYTAHPRASEVPGAWYTTHDGLVGVGSALSRSAAQELLGWVEMHWAGLHGCSDDLRINLWAMATGRLIHTTVPSLVDHQLPDSSTVGNEHHDARRPVVPPGEVRDWTSTPVHLGRQYYGNHWELVFRATFGLDLERVYLAHRHGEPVSQRPHVVIATPAYQPPELAHLHSVMRAVEDLRSHGIEVTHYVTPGDSLVTRGRHCIVHDFLCSTGTHLLQWDADIECLDPTAVRRMVETGRPIIGGAYPFRDGSGAVVANLRDEDIKSRRIDIRSDRTIPVREVGTGFLMVRRDVLIDLQQRHPDLLYQADLHPYRGAPMWALFDATIEKTPNGRSRYASEDWRFCSLAHEAGYEVSIYYPPRFRHWGRIGHEGDLVKAWGIKATRS